MTGETPSDQEGALTRLVRAIRDRVLAGRDLEGRPGLARPAFEGVSDVQYGIDALSEEGLPELVEELFAPWLPLRLLAEGLEEEGRILGEGTPETILVVDPVDGTRGLMHDKRSAFVLAALGPDEGASLRRLEVAAMAEIPTRRSSLSDVIVGRRGAPLSAWIDDLRGELSSSLDLQPSRATELLHGFATVNRFIGGAKEALGGFEDRLFERLYPGDERAWHAVFEDQFISNGGQLHSLMTGRDLFVADLRPLFANRLGRPLLASHPYDLCTLLLAEAVGVVVSDAEGKPLDAPLTLDHDVAWVAYANEALRDRVEPALLAVLSELR